MDDLTEARGAHSATPAAPEPTPSPRPSFGAQIDAELWSLFARATGGFSPLSAASAWFDWMSHALVSPGWRVETGLRNAGLMAQEAADVQAKALSVLRDKPLDGMALYLTVLESLQAQHDLLASMLESPQASPRGVSRNHAEQVAFLTRQLSEALHPANMLLTNPEALRATMEERGANLWRGYLHFLEDMRDQLTGAAQEPQSPAGIGERLAATPGKVVYRNALIELIQYEPQTENVRREPVVITPAWIMKYYILDLAPGASLIEYLVRAGYTVFAISWRNPGADDRDMAFDDYRRHGVMAAFDAVGALVPDERIHAVGYCLGGTLLTVAAAAMARENDHRLASLTLFAAQTDFSDPGELSLFIDEAQLALLEAGMSKEGYLTGDQMAGAFALLRSRELIWRRMQQAYYLGQREAVNELMAWNRDTTRMPYKMHSEYLRKFFLNNDFAQGRFHVDGRPTAVSDIRAPIFALGTKTDHVAPWRSVYKIHLLADTEVTFALTNGGHNAGVVSPPEHPRRKHQIATKADCEYFLAPDGWAELTPVRNGSWWPSWLSWLSERSSGERPARPPARAGLPDNALDAKAALPAAPGGYVRD